MRKLITLSCGFVVALVVTGCVPGPVKEPGPPPPPPSPHRDVVMFGDSNGWGIGCYLGHEGIASASRTPLPCIPQPDFSTQNESLGACTIAGGTSLLYNRQTIAPSCANWRSSWPGILTERTPRLVVLSTSGWEISDRWINFPPGCNPFNAHNCAEPDYQWGSIDANDAALLQATKARYQGELSDAIALFRSRGAEVLVTNSPYYAPDEPQVPGLADWWYERYQDDGGSGTPGYADWVAPNMHLSYRPSERKTDQFNAAVKEVVDQAAANNPAGTVQLLDLWDVTSPLNPGTNDREYNDYSCGPSNKTQWPQNGCPASTIQQRDLADHGHFTQDGYERLVMPVVFTRVRQMLS
jgi:hypothetical protein